MQFRTFKAADHLGWTNRFMRKNPAVNRDEIARKLKELMKNQNLVTETILYPTDVVVVFVRLHDGGYRLEPLTKVLLGEFKSPLPLVGESLRTVQSVARPLFVPKPKLEW